MVLQTQEPILAAYTSKKVNIQTFGCQMNEYDTDKMMEVLRQENYIYTDDCKEADLIIVNTCSVREKAEQKVYSLLGRLRPLKERNPDLIIGVGGCVAQQEGTRILNRAHSVDLVFGTDNLFDLPGMLEEVHRGNRIVQTERKAHKQKVRNFIPDFAFENTSKPGLKSYIAITKGCNNFCSFCIVPTTRGLEVSRKPENIMEEAVALVAQGAKELCLLGQNVNSYKAGGVDFVELLVRLNEIEGLERIRFTSPHPKDFHEQLAEAIENLEHVCEHLHLPLQAGSDSVLDRMKRNYTLQEYLEKVEMLRRRLPQVAISTDIIVGFPGESDVDFERTVKAVETIRFDQIYAFKYSPRPGTPAVDYDGQLEESVKSDRLNRLLALQEKIVAQKHQQLMGEVLEVLVEGTYPRDIRSRSGRSRGHYPVVILNSDANIGDLVTVRITGTKKYSLEALSLQ
ncbi:MAG: tRNA (N6-isopentenyl adenosine(37)-C2)-methylthiotransferase MiaB [SAR324 cluster bacterium]|nr:tRNA (N6-isopentenyl adenosine(37)-C2)-methylthiotransferase MiaB [SAR324 cluster bacterium]